LLEQSWGISINFTVNYAPRWPSKSNLSQLTSQPHEKMLGGWGGRRSGSTTWKQGRRGAEALCPALVGTVEVLRIKIMPWPQAAECNMITNKHEKMLARTSTGLYLVPKYSEGMLMLLLLDLSRCQSVLCMEPLMVFNGLHICRSST
jgi:hypothetical protein